MAGTTTARLYFFGMKSEHGYLSQWYPARFQQDMNIFNSAEQYMMYSKAILFGDQEIANTILAETSPAKIKAMGRRISGFDEDTWDQHKYAIVVQGNILKFSQNKDIGDKLLGTGSAMLIEASPFDKVWGIGFGARTADANRYRWGQNLLGKALMEARAYLQRGI